MFKIDFDARTAGFLTGIGCYTDNLLAHLLRVAPDNDCYLLQEILLVFIISLNLLLFITKGKAKN